jgi:GntR family transcriptional regulator, galactonate operon transcriptional repressor
LQDLNYRICAERGSDADLARIERAYREMDAA